MTAPAPTPQGSSRGSTARVALRVGPVAVIGAAAFGALVLLGPEINGHSLIPPCPFRTLTGHDCPLCGGTRAVRSLLGGDLGAALDYNVVVTVAVLAAGAVALWWLASRLVPRVGSPPVLAVAQSRGFLFGLLAVLVVFWVLRDLPLVPYLGSAT